MRSSFKDGRLYLHRTSEERAPLLQRLGRIEGQVRGLQQMILQERYCGDELQQARAILAAMRGLMRLLITQHVGEGLDRATDGTLKKAEALRDIEKVLLPLLRGN
jgi:DNA-binding FrmR family transcriptional regulator|nr:metal-sensitive transcriptional regulator [Acidisoma sp. L85]